MSRKCEMKAQGIGATEIAKVLSTGRASVYRVLEADGRKPLAPRGAALVSLFRPAAQQAQLPASESGHAHRFLPLQ